MILRSRFGVEVDLCWKIRAGIFFGVHVEWRHLRIPQIARIVGLEDTAGEGFGIIAGGEEPVALYTPWRWPFRYPGSLAARGQRRCWHF